VTWSARVDLAPRNFAVAVTLDRPARIARGNFPLLSSRLLDSGFNQGMRLTQGSTSAKSRARPTTTDSPP
jgi:hypothetical protein